MVILRINEKMLKETRICNSTSLSKSPFDCENAIVKVLQCVKDEKLQ